MGMLPGIGRVVRSRTNCFLENHSYQNLIKILPEKGHEVMGVIGVFHKNNPELRQIMRKMKIPVVNVASFNPPEWCSNMIMDNRAIGRMAAQHLADLGHPHFGYCGLGNFPLSQEREKGFREGLKEYFGKEITLHQPEETQSRRQFLGSLPRPTALFCASDLRARRMANTALSMGLQIPDELALLGVDNDPYECELSRVPLSSVAIDLERMGEQAADLMVDIALADGTPAIKTIQVPPRRVVRRLSSNHFNVDDELVRDALRLIRSEREYPWRVSELASVLGVSRRKLELRFQSAGQGTIFGAIHDARMDRARELLENTSLKIADIGTRIGISDAKRFAALFREKFHCTPMQFKKQVGGS